MPFFKSENSGFYIPKAIVAALLLISSLVVSVPSAKAVIYVPQQEFLDSTEPTIAPAGRNLPQPGSKPRERKVITPTSQPSSASSEEKGIEIIDQTRTGLPFDLKWGMTKQEVQSQLKIMDVYRIVNNEQPDTIAYSIPAPDTNTRNGLFLDFNNNKLVQINSTKFDMNTELYKSYMDRLLKIGMAYEAEGMQIVVEDKVANIYVYKNSKNVIKISGNGQPDTDSNFMAGITFTDTSYDSGYGTPKQPASNSTYSGFTELKKAAENGDAQAQVELGVKYDSGDGVPKDEAEARKWYRKSAEQGNDSAQFYLGAIYYVGRGTPKDLSEAAKWFRKSAEHGTSSAPGYFLSIIYEDGIGVPKDLAEAYMWINLAAPQRSGIDPDVIINHRKYLEIRMTPAQIAEGQRLSREWTQKHSAKP